VWCGVDGEVVIRDDEVFSGCVFFFKQKKAYEVVRGLVGSGMVIRDRT